MAFPAPPHSFLTKDEVADYLETYAARFDLPVELGVHVDGLDRNGERIISPASAPTRRTNAPAITKTDSNR